jgi:uncharacterized protein YraI
MAETSHGDGLTELQVRRQRRARWHRRRRVIGFLVFTLVAAAVLFVAWRSVASDDEPTAQVASSTIATTTPPIPPAGPYKVTDGVNVRTGPSTSYPSVGTIEPGKEVMVTCVASGETINGPRGPVSTWVRVTAPGITGFVASQYVATGNAINDPHVIPPCPA